MDADQRDELRMLRARAFGPSSDIHEDPAALSRLSELEELARTSQRTEKPSPVSVGEAEDPEVSTVDEPRVQEPDAPPEPSPPARDGLRTRALWVASLVATAAVAVAVTAATTPIISVPRPPDARLVGTIEIDESAGWPPMFGEPQSDSVVYEDFYGLTALRQGGSVFGQGDTECVMIFETGPLRSPTDSYEGPSFYGCGAGAFPPRVPVLIQAGMPTELIVRFPVGTALEFVLDGERLGVFSDAD